MLMFKMFLGALRAAIPASFGRPEGMPYLRYVMACGLRAMSFDSRYNNPQGTGAVEAYKVFAKQQKFEPIVVQLNGGGEGYWFGPTSAKKVVLFFPGGAYSNPASEGFFLRYKSLVAAAKSQDVDLAVFVLSYGEAVSVAGTNNVLNLSQDLSPKATYPTQLKQAAGSLEYLLKNKGLTPAGIILAGDSAGGNLALAMLSHLSHPHPDVPVVDLGGQVLRGVALISPWVSFDYDTPSAKANQDIDMISAFGCKGASKQFLGSVDEDEYTVPLRASPDWWKNAKAEQTLITSGSYEIFASDIASFAEKYQVHNSRTEVYEAKYEIHDQGLIDTMLGYELPESEKLMQRWIIESLGRVPL